MLAEQWRELNSAQLALGQRELSWMHIFIPGLERMPEAVEAYNRHSLFVGRDETSTDDGALMGELTKLSQN